MSNIIQYIKENIKTMFITILIYQIFLTIFSFTNTNLIILAVIIIIESAYLILNTYMDDIKDFLKK